MNDDPSEDFESAVESWRKAGRCSSCSLFVSDYGGAPDFYGHCKMYPRNGSRECSDYACGEYEPLKGFDRLTKSTSRELDITLAKEKARRISSPQPGIRRRVIEESPRPSSPPEVRRRQAVSPAVQPHASASVTAQPSPRPAMVASASTASVAPSRPAAGVDPEMVRDVVLEALQSVLCIEEIEIGGRWEDGSLILEPANPDQKPQVMPIETFWNKIVMVRDRLRVLEQKINSHDTLTNAEKVDLQQYISRCYGSLTSFNVLFKNREDRFSSKG